MSGWHQRSQEEIDTSGLSHDMQSRLAYLNREREAIAAAYEQQVASLQEQIRTIREENTKNTNNLLQRLEDQITISESLLKRLSTILQRPIRYRGSKK